MLTALCAGGWHPIPSDGSTAAPNRPAQSPHVDLALGDDTVACFQHRRPQPIGVVVGNEHLPVVEPELRESIFRVLAETAVVARVQNERSVTSPHDSSSLCVTAARGVRDASRNPRNITITPIARKTLNTEPRPYRATELPTATIVAPSAISQLPRMR